MGLFTPSFDKPGKGVDENAPQKRSFFRFFDIFSRKFTHFVRSNLIYVLALIPTFLVVFFLAGTVTARVLSNETVQGFLQSVAAQTTESLGGDIALTNEYLQQLEATFDLFGRVVISFLFAILWGMGPATAGTTYVMRNFAREEHAWLWSDFKDAIKNNFKQSLAVFAIDLVAFYLFSVAIHVYAQMPGWMNALQYVVWIVVVLYTIMHFYLYPMMVTFQLSLCDLYRNAFLFAVGKLPSNLFVLVVLLGIHLGLIYLITMFGGGYFGLLLFLLLVLEVTVLLSFSSFLVNFNTYPKMKKYMMEETEEEASV